jgi:hypothetical protein
MDAATDDNVGWSERLKIAANTLRVLELLRSFPAAHGGRSRAVYGDLFAKQFAIDANYVVKVVDVHSFLPYNESAFGIEHRCTSDTDCHGVFWWTAGTVHVMRGLRRLQPPPNDFGCDVAASRCRGLDSRTVALALCHLLIEPLIELGAAQTPPHILIRVRHLLMQCRDRSPETRLPAEDLIAALEALVPAKNLRPLELVNANISEYLLAKERFEALRRHLDGHANE